jgi:hypothetical protein
LFRFNEHEFGSHAHCTYKYYVVQNSRFLPPHHDLYTSSFHLTRLPFVSFPDHDGGGGRRSHSGNKNFWAALPRNSINLVSHTVTAVMLLACIYLRRSIARIRGLNIDNCQLELTSNCTIPELALRGQLHNSSSDESNFSASPASSTMPLPDFHQRHPHSHVNKSYTNTYSSCGSFTLPSIIGLYTFFSFFYFVSTKYVSADKYAV